EQAHGKPGIIYLPTAGPPILAVHSFAMFNELGEGVFMHGDTLAEAYDQLEHLPWFTGQAYGLRSFNNIKGATIGHMPRIGALLAMGAEPRLFGRPSVRTSSYVTRSAADMATWQIWGAWSWIDRATAQWHPHWANGDMVSSSAGGAEHYVSFHLQPGRRVLLVATNYSTRPATIDVKLNLEALGFNADAPLRALDIVTGKEVPIDAGRLSLDAGPELFR